MPINPIPEPSKTDKITYAVSKASDYGWHTAMFLLGTIVGFIIGYAV